jgi:hypothetical protein
MPIPPDLGVHDPHPDQFARIDPLGLLVSAARRKGRQQIFSPPTRQRIAIFYTKPCNRLLRPLAAADQPQAPPALYQALAVIDHHVDDYIAQARLKPAA